MHDTSVIRSSVRGSGCSLGFSGDTEGTVVLRYFFMKTFYETYSRLQGFVLTERGLCKY